VKLTHTSEEDEIPNLDIARGTQNYGGRAVPAVESADDRHLQ